MASTLAGIRSQSSQAAHQAAAVAAAAQQQVRSDQAIIELRRAQTSDNITLEQVRRMRQGQRERGVISARLGDAGVAGGSTLRTAVASAIQEDEDIGTLGHKGATADAQLNLERRGAEVRALSQLGKAQDIYQQGQTSVGAGVLQFISAGVSGYSTGKRLEPIRRPKGGST